MCYIHMKYNLFLFCVNVIFAAINNLEVHIDKNRFCFLFTMFFDVYYF